MHYIHTRFTEQHTTPTAPYVRKRHWNIRDPPKRVPLRPDEKSRLKDQLGGSSDPHERQSGLVVDSSVCGVIRGPTP
jgi:hypothetical protein